MNQFCPDKKVPRLDIALLESFFFPSTEADLQKSGVCHPLRQLKRRKMSVTPADFVEAQFVTKSNVTISILYINLKKENVFASPTAHC